MNGISFKRVWQDEEFFEVEIEAFSDVVTSKTKVYITDRDVVDLSEKILKLCFSAEIRCFWEISEKGDDDTPYVSLEFCKSDKLGHIKVEVYMEIDDGGSLSKHTCCYFIETELGILGEFAQRLPKINQKNLGIKVVL
jgi:hypothetical protein